MHVVTIKYFYEVTVHQNSAKHELNSCLKLGTAHNKWDFYVVRASLNLSARVANSCIYFCEYYNRTHDLPEAIGFLFGSQEAEYRT